VQRNPKPGSSAWTGWWHTPLTVEESSSS